MSTETFASTQNKRSLKRAGVISATCALMLSLGMLGTGFSYLHSADDASTNFTNPMSGVDATEMLVIQANALEDAGDIVPMKAIDVDSTVKLREDAIDNAYVSVAFQVPATQKNVKEGYKVPDGYTNSGGVILDSAGNVDKEKTAEYQRVFDFEVAEGWVLQDIIPANEFGIGDTSQHGGCFYCGLGQDALSGHDDACPNNKVVYLYKYDKALTPGETVPFVDTVTVANLGNQTPDAEKLKDMAESIVIDYSFTAVQETGFDSYTDTPDDYKTIIA